MRNKSLNMTNRIVSFLLIISFFLCIFVWYKVFEMVRIKKQCEYLIEQLYSNHKDKIMIREELRKYGVKI